MNSSNTNSGGWSRPAWGAWIEIAALLLTAPALLWSRPAWGAWIEILSNRNPAYNTDRRAPHGARGLKFIFKKIDVCSDRVAPRMGRVD